MSFDWNEFNDFINKINKHIKCCDNYIETIIDGFKTCITCGLVDINSHVFQHNNNSHIINKYPYKRYVYFKQKLNYINCITYYKLNPKLIYFIECNKNKNIRSISRLKKVMKKVGLNKYYKYIYSIYQSITGKQMINIPMNTYDKYVNQFINLERIFLKHKIRKNLYSYNVILFLLMKLNGCPDYKHLILPLNKNKLRKKLKDLFILCGYNIS